MTTSNQRLIRSDVPVEQTWDLTDLFSTHEEWTKELEALKDDISKITGYKGTLESNAKTLLDCLEALSSYEERLIRVATYANLRSSADGSNPDNQRDMAKVSAAMADIGAQLSFIDSELLTIPKETIERFLNDETDLQTYKKMLFDLLEKKEHTLSPEIEETLAALSEVHGAPHMIYQRSKAADMEFDSITDDDGNVLPMSAALYEDSYEMAAETTIRRGAYQSFVKTLNQYKNTYAAIYATEVNRQISMSRLRNYESVTDMLLESQQVTKEMYHNQLDVIQKELAPHMRRFAKLKQEKLGLDDMRYSDLQAPLDPDFNPETTYEEATDTILEALSVMGPEYTEIMKKGIQNRWIDRADNVGKATGAFCSSPYGVHPYILVTWTNAMRGAFILAHELGHAG
ncbi:MAG TPA: M3 family metallopeptidase, partial [Bacillota bacterium]|nr:M3 family metallopeptidase [Bacillota bacterium]